MIKDFVLSSWQLLNISSFWLVISFFLCGLLHIVLRPEFLQQSLGNTKLSSLVKATISGMLLPICSCGVVPLALSLYYSGAYLGPTLAFLVATPIINPAADFHFLISVPTSVPNQLSNYCFLHIYSPL
jgi:uncharacterized membrane protein YraQ (UPF0718 family)